MDYLYRLHLKSPVILYTEHELLSLRMFGKGKVSLSQEHVEAVTVSNKRLGGKTTDTEIRMELSLKKDSKSIVYP